MKGDKILEVPTSEFDAQRFFTDSEYAAPALVAMYAGEEYPGTISAESNNTASWGSAVLDHGESEPTIGGEGPGVEILDEGKIGIN